MSNHQQDHEHITYCKCRVRTLSLSQPHK